MRDLFGVSSFNNALMDKFMTQFPLISPHGGALVDRIPIGQDAAMLAERAAGAPRVLLSALALSDLELIATGGYSPLTGFMGRKDYDSVLRHMHLANGRPWALPITLPVDDETAQKLRPGQDVALVSGAGQVVGLLELTEKFSYDKRREAGRIFRTEDAAHPGVARLYEQGDVYLAGPVWMLILPAVPFPDLFYTPAQTRALFAERGWRMIAAFQTRNPIHRAHEYLLKCALEIADGLMVHPLVGETKGDDIPADVRVDCYTALLKAYFPPQRTLLAAFPAAMRYAGPREAIFHAICRKNYGCTHFIVGRDHAGVGAYYGPYDAQHIFREFDPAEIGITPLFFEHAFYCRACAAISTAKTCPHPISDHLQLSGTQVRSLLAAGESLPTEFTRPEVSRILQAAPVMDRH